MDCQEARAFIEAAVDDQLPQPDIDRLNLHMNECQQCRSLYQLDVSIHKGAAGLQVDAPETLLPGLMYRIRNDKKQPRFAFGRFTTLAVAAAAVLLLLNSGDTVRAWLQLPTSNGNEPSRSSQAVADSAPQESSLGMLTVPTDKPAAAQSAAAQSAGVQVDNKAEIIEERLLAPTTSALEPPSDQWDAKARKLVESYIEAVEQGDMEKISTLMTADGFRLVEEQSLGGHTAVQVADYTVTFEDNNELAALVVVTLQDPPADLDTEVVVRMTFTEVAGTMLISLLQRVTV